MAAGPTAYDQAAQDRRDRRNATRRRWYSFREEKLTTNTEDLAAYLRALHALAIDHQARRRAAGKAAGPTIGSP